MRFDPCGLLTRESLISQLTPVVTPLVRTILCLITTLGTQHRAELDEKRVGSEPALGAEMVREPTQSETYRAMRSQTCSRCSASTIIRTSTCASFPCTSFVRMNRTPCQCRPSKTVWQLPPSRAITTPSNGTRRANAGPRLLDSLAANILASKGLAATSLVKTLSSFSVIGGT